MRIFFLFLILCSNALNAQDQDFWVLANAEAPFIVADDKGKLSGYAVELVNAVLTEADISQQILLAPWTRIEKEARIKSNVLVFALARTPEREEHYHWITPITANMFGLYSANGQTPLRDINQVKILPSVGVLGGDIREQILQANGASKIMTYDNWSTTLEAMLDGKVSAMFFSDAGISIFCQRLERDCSDVERILSYRTTYSYLVLSKPGTDPLLAQRLQEAALSFKKSAKFKQLSETWLAHYQQLKLAIPMHLDRGVLKLWKK